jgi:hypothetical protein
MKRLSLILVLCLLVGCRTSIKPQQPEGSVSTDPIHSDSDITLVRTYHVQLSQGRMLIVTAKQTHYHSLYPGGVEFGDELTQSDGNDVFFDCDHVADKILDRDLVPEVERWCAFTHKDGLYYWENTPPAEFTDSDGIHWKKEQP